MLPSSSLSSLCVRMHVDTYMYIFFLIRGSSYLESPVGHFESYGAPNCYQAPRQLVGLPENTVMLDEMTLRHMVQDCTAVKTQLLKLKRLLHQVSCLNGTKAKNYVGELSQLVCHLALLNCFHFLHTLI